MLRPYVLWLRVVGLVELLRLCGVAAIGRCPFDVGAGADAGDRVRLLGLRGGRLTLVSFLKRAYLFGEHRVAFTRVTVLERMAGFVRMCAKLHDPLAVVREF